MHRFTRPFATRARRRSVAVLATLALAAGLAGLTQASATTAFDPAAAETGASGPMTESWTFEYRPWQEQ